MKIAVDIDDTLNIIDRAARAGEYIKHQNLPFKLVDPNSCAFIEMYDWKEEDVLRFIREGGITAFTDAEARKWAKEVLEGWQKDGHEVVILTARKKNWFENPEKLSRDWLEKRHIPYDELVADVAFGEKGKYCAENDIAVLVDDSIEACLDAQAHGVRAVLAVNRCNLPRAKEIRYGGANWRQIDAAVRHIISVIETLGRAE